MSGGRSPAHQRSASTRSRGKAINEHSPTRLSRTRNAQRYAESRDQPGERRRDLLIGPSGTGKTLLARRLCYEFGRDGRASLHANCSDYLRIMDGAWRADAPTLSQVESHYMAPDLLVLDDLSHRTMTADDRRNLERLIRQRQERLRVTILITETNARTFIDTVGMEVAQLLESGCFLRCRLTGAWEILTASQRCRDAAIETKMRRSNLPSWHFHEILCHPPHTDWSINQLANRMLKLVENGSVMAMTGTTRSGKTLVATRLAADFLSWRYSVRYVDASMLTGDTGAVGADPFGWVTRVLRKVGYPDLLIIDELHAWPLERLPELRRIVSTRLDTKATLLVMNHERADLTSLIGDEIFQRCRDNGLVELSAPHAEPVQ